jgi:hypothetical protein
MTKNSANAALDREAQMAATVERLKRNLALLQERIALLEQENTAFAGMLKERGVDVRASSQMAQELPPPLIRPLESNAEVFGRLTQAQRELLNELRGADFIFMLLKSGSTVDTGGWFGRGEVWVCALARELALFAAGRKPFLQKTPFTHLNESLYNHVTGELILAPSQGLKLARAAMPPLDGYQMLAQIYRKQNQGDRP